MNIQLVKRNFLLLAFCAITALVTQPLFGQEENGQKEKITYNDHAKPIFKQRCARCHNPNKKSGGLDLTNYTNMMLGGSSGSSIEPGDSDGSYLYMLITHQEQPVMPPGDKIPEEEIQLLATWINGGALESKTSVAQIAKPTVDMAVGENPNARPETIPLPPRLSKEPVLHTERPSNATTIATSPWAPIAAVGMAQQVLLYDTANLTLTGVLPFPEGTVHQLRFSRNGTILIAGGGKDGASGVVVGWDIRTGERVFSVGDELDAVLAADISTDHTQIALGGPGEIVKVYSTQTGEMLYEITKHTEWVTALEFSPDGNFLTSGDRNGGLYVFEADTGEEYLTLNGHTEQVTGVTWRVDGKILASASEDGTTRIWELENGKQLKSWPAHDKGATDVDFTRDGNILTSGRDRIVALWKQDGKPIRKFAGLKDIAIACAFCDESQRVIGSDWSGVLRVWDPADKTHQGDLDTNPVPIQTRIELAQKELQAINEKVAAMQKNHQRMVTNLQTKNDAIAKKTAAQNATRQKRNANQNALANGNRRIQEIKATQTRLQAVDFEAKQANLERLGNLLEQAEQVARDQPDDQDLTSVAELLAKKVARLKSNIAKQSQAKLAANNELVALTAEQTRLESAINDAETNLTQLAIQLNGLRASRKVLAPKVAEQKAKTEATAAKQRKLETTLQYWRSEQQFSQQLNALYTELTNAESEFIQRAEEAEAKKQGWEQAQTAQAAAQKKLESVQQTIRDARRKNAK